MLRSAARLIALALLIAGAAAATLGGTSCIQGICSRSSDCATGLVCSMYGKCVVPADAAAASPGDAASGSTTTDAAESTDDAAFAIREAPGVAAPVGQ